MISITRKPPHYSKVSEGLQKIYDVLSTYSRERLQEEWASMSDEQFLGIYVKIEPYIGITASLARNPQWNYIARLMAFYRQEYQRRGLDTIPLESPD